MMRAFSSERALGQCHGMIHGEGYGLCGWTQSPLFHFNIRLWWWVKEQAGAQTGSWAQCVIPPFIYTIFFISAIFCPWLDFGLPPQYPQAVWRHWREIEPFSAMLDGLAECDQPGNTPPRPGIEPGLRGGQTERYIHSPTELPCPRPWRGQTVRYIHSPTELSWPGPWREQTERYNHSPTELSWPGPWRGQTERYIHSPTELSWPGPWREQTVRYIHSPTELSWPGPWRGQTERYIHSPIELSWLTSSHTECKI